MSVDERLNKVADSYDLVADEYVVRIYDELKHKPLDRHLLDRFAAELPARQLACDLGCGPGQIARYLHECGVRICGVDLSPAMIACARKLNPDIAFTQGDMRAIPLADSSWSGIAAFYAIVNLSPVDLDAAFREMRRVLQPGGVLLLSFHMGSETVHLSDWWGKQVSIDFHFFRKADVIAKLEGAGFTIEEVIEREPYPEVEHQSQRAYVFARR